MQSEPEAVDGGFFAWLDAPLSQGGIALDDIERTIYAAAVTRRGRNLSAAARLLGLTRAQLAYRLKTGERLRTAGRGQGVKSGLRPSGPQESAIYDQAGR